ncbi:MAG: patatin-like phospholipase family protein [Bacteroidetes bacterium]|nr:patatin-like phospholipase family protein [Bacteroidota bacterium]
MKTVDNAHLDQSVDFSSFAEPNSRDNQDSSRLIIYCASGGGARAASFNTGILLELENILTDIAPKKSNSNVLNEIDYFSTTSGGGWGVSSYIAYLYQKQKYSAPQYQRAIKQFNDSLNNPGSKDYISNYQTFNQYENYLANRSDFRYFKHQTKYIFWFNTSQRSTRIISNRMNAGYLGWMYRANLEEKTWKYIYGDKVPFNTSKVDEICLGDIFKPKGVRTQIPIQIANTTNVDDYKLVPFTPDRLLNYGVVDYVHYLDKKPKEVHNNNVFNYDSIPFVTGVHASSGIPFAIGATTLKAKKTIKGKTIEYYLHLQDGGIVEQQAMHSAKAILRAHDKIKDRNKRIVIIVDASASGLTSTKKRKKIHIGRWYNGFRLLSPMVAPNTQYPITRERIKLLEQEYNCTVIYLGTELLLSDSLGNQVTLNRDLKASKKELTKKFEKYYDAVKKDNAAFLQINKDEKKLLYAYIEQYMYTAWSSKGSKKGKYLDSKFTGTAMVMYLAGRGVVQLKRRDILEIMDKK